MKSTFKIRISCALLVLFMSVSAAAWGQKNERTKLEWTLANAKTESAKTEAFIALGKYYMKSDFVRLDSITKIILKASLKFSKLNRVKLTIFVAESYDLLGNYEGIHEIFPYFENLDFTGLSAQLQGEILGNVAYVYMVQNNRKLSQSTLNKALQFAKQARDFSLATTILNLKAYEALIYKERKNALLYSDQAMEFAKRSSDRIDLAYCFNTKANIYQHFGENEISIRKNFLAFKIANKENSLYQIARFAMEIGQLQENVSNHSGAKYYYEICLKNATKIRDRGQIGHVSTYLANVLRHEKKFAESQKMNYEALKIIDVAANPVRAGDIEASIGLNYVDLDSLPEAMIHFKKANTLYEIGKNENRKAEVYLFMGEVLFKQKKYSQSLNSLLKSKQIASTFGSPNAGYRTYPLISKIYALQNKHQLALTYLTEYVEFSEKIKEKQARDKVAQLGEEFRSEERDRALALQSENLEKQKHIRQLTEAELENATLRSRMQTYFLIAFFIVTILATVIGIYRFRQVTIQRKRKQAEMSQTLLRSQMNPHFIFNAMSVIQSYIYDNDIEKSSHFLVSFSRLIRLILENSPKEFISIETDIEILTKYLETQKLRFEKRFDYEIICAEELIFEKTLIPPMITQPFVENSIEHGKLHLKKDGKIIVRFFKKDNMLVVEIEDNGVGRKSAEKNKSDDATHTSMATSITEERIRILNETEDAQGFLLIIDKDKIENTGTKVVISLPFKKELTVNQ